MIKKPNSSQEPPLSPKVSKWDLKDMDVLCTININLESKNLDHGFLRVQESYPNHNQDATAQSGICSVIQSHKL